MIYWCFKIVLRACLKNLKCCNTTIKYLGQKKSKTVSFEYFRFAVMDASLWSKTTLLLLLFLTTLFAQG